MTISRRAMLCVLLLAAGFLTARAQQPAAPTRLVLVFGDSITAGNMLPADESSQLWLNLVEQRSGGRLHLINEGKGGRPTNSVAEFKAALGRHPQVDVLVIALGMNDSRDIGPGCVPKAVSHLQAMLNLAKTAYGKIPVLLVGPSNIRKDALGPSRNIADQRTAKLTELNAAFATLAASNQAAFVSLYGVVPESSLTKDGVHPDAKGNAAIADVMLPKLLSLAQ
jgi:acyl-CoA thioesterase-1